MLLEYGYLLVIPLRTENKILCVFLGMCCRNRKEIGGKLNLGHNQPVFFHLSAKTGKKLQNNNKIVNSETRFSDLLSALTMPMACSRATQPQGFPDISITYLSILHKRL